MPPATIFDKIGYIRRQNSIRTVQATYYDCLVDEVIVGAPVNPGIMGRTDNPGLPIRWEDINVVVVRDPDVPTLSEAEKCPYSHIGKYKFEDITAGSYVIEITRPGFLTRYGVITVEGDDYLGHREILAGDVNGDMMITEKDLSTIRTKISNYGSSLYNAAYDLRGTRGVSSGDINIIGINLGAYCTIYQETFDFITNF